MTLSERLSSATAFSIFSSLRGHGSKITGMNFTNIFGCELVQAINHDKMELPHQITTRNICAGVKYLYSTWNWFWVVEGVTLTESPESLWGWSDASTSLWISIENVFLLCLHWFYSIWRCTTLHSHVALGLLHCQKLSLFFSDEADLSYRSLRG